MAIDRSEDHFPSCILLTGVKHCGKSTVGRLLAEEWGVPFFDLDDLVETNCADETGRTLSCRDIYREYGKPNFIRYEAAAAERLKELAGSRSSGSGPVSRIAAVAALGGGTAENREAISALESFGLFVLFDADPEELFERIKRGGIPPFLLSKPGRMDEQQSEGLRPVPGSPGGGVEKERDIYGRFLELYVRRMKLYKRRADIIIDIRGKNPREITGETAREIKRYLHQKVRGRKNER